VAFETSGSRSQVSAPYLLVGHSLGGAYVQRYAQRFPDEAAGLLLLDPAHEDWDLARAGRGPAARQLGRHSDGPDVSGTQLAANRDRSGPNPAPPARRVRR